MLDWRLCSWAGLLFTLELIGCFIDSPLRGNVLHGLILCLLFLWPKLERSFSAPHNLPVCLCLYVCVYLCVCLCVCTVLTVCVNVCGCLLYLCICVCLNVYLCVLFLPLCLWWFKGLSLCIACSSTNSPANEYKSRTLRCVCYCFGAGLCDLTSELSWKRIQV